MHDRRQVIATIHDQDVTHKLFADIGPRYADRPAATRASSSSARARVTTRPWRASNWCDSLRAPRDPADAPVPEPEPVTDPALVAGSPRPPRCADVAYDGTGLPRASPRSPSQRTVAGVLAGALEQLLRGDVADFACAGRTDAGVHAWGQVVSVRRPGPASTRDELRPRAHPAPRARDRRARRAGWSTPGFDARHSAHRAHLPLHGGEPARPRPVPRPVRLVGARAARPARAAPRRRPVRGRARLRRLLPPGPRGLDDGAPRAATPTGTTSATACCATRSAPTAFCWQMVRSIVGTLVEVGTGKQRPGELMGILRGREPLAAAGSPAPPDGLCLWEVGY